jgi:hypothetical protein
MEKVPYKCRFPINPGAVLEEFYCLLVLSLLNNAVSSLGYIPTSGRMLNKCELEMM